MKGSYCLIIHNKRDSTLTIGKQGKIEFKTGFFVYIGSALNSLEGRIKRHISSSKKIFWHVDYLLASPHTHLKEVIYGISPHKRECAISQFLSLKANSIANFGSSDCQCQSHLFYFKEHDLAQLACQESFSKLNLHPKSFKISENEFSFEIS